MTRQEADGALASNVRAMRQAYRLTQARLALRMQQAGHNWQRVTVAEVETGRRYVHLDELITLTNIFGTDANALIGQTELPLVRWTTCTTCDGLGRVLDQEPAYS